MNPVISVVMPVYNGERYLDEAIQSILNQTYKDFEFIIINDGSTDKSLEIIEKYKNQDERIVLISRENKGLIASLNEGIKQSQGKYIARMDADDISLPERFKEQVKLMEKNNLDLCGCHYFTINEIGNYKDTVIVPYLSDMIVAYLSITVPFAHPSVFIKKSFIESNNLQYGFTSMKNAEDYSLWNEFWNKNAKFGNVNEFLFKYRDFNGSLSKTNKRNIMTETNLISKQFILQNKIQLNNIIESINISNLAKQDQEIIVLIICKLIRYNFRFKYFKLFSRFAKRAVICGILKYATM